jgi:hypothetical protein
MEDKSELIGMTADIVSAYVGNNSVSTTELPNLITSIHRALAGVNGAVEAPVEAAPKEPAVPVKKSVAPDYIDLPGGRAQVQVAEAPPAHQVQHEPRGVPRQVGPAEGLPHGRPRTTPRRVRTWPSRWAWARAGGKLRAEAGSRF